MKKYHINNEGNAKQCSAKKGNCPYGSDAPHFDTRKEAEKYYENNMTIKTIKPVKKMKIYRVGTLTAPETYFDDLDNILQDMDRFKPEDRQGRYKGIFASPDLNSHAKWVRGNSWNKHEGALDSHEITVDGNSVYVYNVEDYEKASSIQRMYGANSEKFKESAEKFWNSGMTLTEWQEWAKENKPERGSWEIIMSPDSIISNKTLSNRSVIENSSEQDIEELNQILEPNRSKKGLIWRKSNLTEEEKEIVRDEAIKEGFKQDFINDMENIYSKNAYKIDDLYSARKEIYSAILRAKKKRNEDMVTFANLSRDDESNFYKKIKSYIEIIERIQQERTENQD